MLLLETPGAIRFILASSVVLIIVWGRWRVLRKDLFPGAMPLSGWRPSWVTNCTVDILRGFTLPLIKSTTRFNIEENVLMEK